MTAHHRGEVSVVLSNRKCCTLVVNFIGADTKPADTQASQCNRCPTRGISAGGVGFS